MMMNPNFYMQQQYSPLQPQLPTWPPFIQPRGHQSFQNMWPNMPPPPPPLPGGAFINPAFFNNQQSGNQHQNQWKPKEEEK
jgi:H/ACA ribonucleoprotein complex non-core subunit NAF1